MQSITRKLMIFAAADCTIKIWDAKTGVLVYNLEGHLAGISTITWNPDSTVLASGSDDKSIRLWDIKTVRPSSRVTHLHSADVRPRANVYRHH